MVQRKLEWAIAHFGDESRYNVLYRKRQGLGGSAAGAYGQVGDSCHGRVIRNQQKFVSYVPPTAVVKLL